MQAENEKSTIEEKDQTTASNSEKMQEEIIEEVEKTEESAGSITDQTEEISKLNDKYLRLVAEFDNYKRRTSKERIELFTSANKELMTALLPVLDDFERAFKNTKSEDSTEEVIKGFKLIYNKMAETMRQKGLKPMEDCTGKPFDIDSMEAITKVPAPNEDDKGKVIDQIERGYTLGDKVVRYARVVVGQ
ncbi:MAG: nucleotide exchange factor GrpE [Cryomorphaceae bacterium]|nr:nucleotide exchange factor GrpE [Cryomorphaceae bacterium]